MRWSVLVVVAAFGGLSIRGQQPSASSTDPLVQGFLSPPASARPRVWWHWMNGNITREGISADLDWMHRVGIAGFQNFDAALSTPKVVDQRLIYMTPAWKDAFRFAVEKGDALGMEMAVAGSPGWSESGGPWVPLGQAMKKLTWSETSVEGGKPFRGVLPPPPRQTGPIGDRAAQDPLGAIMGGGNPFKVADYGADVMVLAVRQPAVETTMAALAPATSSSAGPIGNPAVLWDQGLNETVAVAAAKGGETSWLRYDFGKPVTMQSCTFAYGGPGNPMAIFTGETGDGPMLQASVDGVTFTDIVRIPTALPAQHTLSFKAVTARYFQVAYQEKPAAPMPSEAAEMGLVRAAAAEHLIAEFTLHAEARVNRFEEKAAFAAVPDLYGFATPETGSAVGAKETVDLTARMQPDGTLNWTPPAGRWTVLRMGYSLTGITNHPAPPEATGPEVDKLDRAAVEAYFGHYLDSYKDATSGMMGARGIRYVITDSWEAGTQNWTPQMLAEFKRRRGYDAVPWMPVLTGRVIGSAGESDRFLWDYRRTIGELLAENHYGTISAMLHARGMGQYGESHESGRATIGDGMEMKRADDVPMSAMWVQSPGVNADLPVYNADIRESASVAHIYGQNVVAAESMTARSNPWGWSPATLKPTADKELAMGLNRFVIHSSVHQPLMGAAPGLTLGPFGQWFNRNETWAEQAKPWLDYLSRSSFLLQQGRFVADLAWFYGEDSNVTAIFEKRNPAVPAGYNFDYVNADIVQHRLRVENGELVTASGMRYRALVLDPYAAHMSLPVLRALEALVRAGATVIGDAPVGTPSLADDTAVYARIVASLWGSGASGGTGKGRVIPGVTAAAIRSAGLSPDFTYDAAGAEQEVLFVHRRTPEAEIYFVDNRTAGRRQLRASFKVAGKAPELWHPDTALMEPVSYTPDGARTLVPLTLAPYETVFVVFRRAANAKGLALAAAREEVLTTVDTPWDVRFEEERGETRQIRMDHLASWSDSAEPGVRFFSGHAVYTSEVNVPAAALSAGSRIVLDLGTVNEIAEVRLNGKPLGTVWKAPYRLDVSSAVHAGTNTLEVRVVNLWVNRLVGDAQPDATGKYTFTARNPYKAESALLPSGLLGPVRLLRRED